MPSKRLTNWRVKLVYHPFVVAQMQPGWTKEAAEQMVASLTMREHAKPPITHGDE
jgi:hypothetical protein